MDSDGGGAGGSGTPPVGRHGHVAEIQEEAFLGLFGFANKDATVGDGDTAMFAACATGYLPMVQWLYEKGVALADGVLLTAGGVLLATGQLSIHCSALSGQLAVIEWMYGRGVLLDIANHDGEQPIHKAAEGGHLTTIF